MLNDELSHLLGVYEVVPLMKDTSKVHFGGNWRGTIPECENWANGLATSHPAQGAAITVAAFCSKADRKR